MSMAPQNMEAPEKKRSPQAWKLRLPWEQQKQAEIQRSAFIQSQEIARASTSSMSTIARAFKISRRRLRLDPDKKLHFLCKLEDSARICPFPVSECIETYLDGLSVEFLFNTLRYSLKLQMEGISKGHLSWKFSWTAPVD